MHFCYHCIALVVSPVSGGGGAEQTETWRPVTTHPHRFRGLRFAWNLSVAAASSEQHHADCTSVSV